MFPKIENESETSTIWVWKWKYWYWSKVKVYCLMAESGLLWNDSLHNIIINEVQVAMKHTPACGQLTAISQEHVVSWQPCDSNMWYADSHVTATCGQLTAMWYKERAGQGWMWSVCHQGSRKVTTTAPFDHWVQWWWGGGGWLASQGHYWQGHYSHVSPHITLLTHRSKGMANSKYTKPTIFALSK